jgi:hypothetical protein
MKYFILSFLCVWGLNATANDPKQLPSNSPKDLMHELLGQITALKDLMVSEAKFLDSKNEIEIAGHLKKMSEIGKKVVHSPTLNAPVFRPSAQVLQEHISETERVFRLGNKSYARWMLNSTLSICMSCHTQVTTDSRQLWSSSLVDNYTSDFDQAEFLFTIRNFTKAHELYKKAIMNYPKNKLPVDKLELALEREVAFFARIKRDASGGMKALGEYQAKKFIPPYLKEDLKVWTRQFKQWKQEDIFELKDPTEDQVKIFIQKHLEKKSHSQSAENPNVVNYLYTSGILYEFLSRHPKTNLTPDILYWLAVCDRGVNNNFFFSLADIYLKDCIIQYPKTSAAQKCYTEYEENTIASYSGSSGTQVPNDAKEELAKLKSLIENKNGN